MPIVKIVKTKSEAFFHFASGTKAIALPCASSEIQNLRLPGTIEIYDDRFIAMYCRFWIEKGKKLSLFISTESEYETENHRKYWFSSCIYHLENTNFSHIYMPFILAKNLEYQSIIEVCEKPIILCIF